MILIGFCSSTSERKHIAGLGLPWGGRDLVGAGNVWGLVGEGGLAGQKGVCPVQKAKHAKDFERKAQNGVGGVKK